MKAKILLPSLLLLSLTPPAAQACPPGHPNSLAYILRDNNRCEGLRDRRYASSTFSLISFFTGNLNNYPDILTLRVPSISNVSPTIEVQSFFRNYRLDSLVLRPGSKGFTFLLNTTVLKRANVPIGSLRATAYITRNSELIYFPVILGQPSGRYEFVVYSPERTTFPTFEIRRNNRAVFRNPRRFPHQGQIHLFWEYGNAPAGTYELYMIDGKGQRRSFRFEHNPNWL